MLAPRRLPQEFTDWNRKYGAPFGNNSWYLRRLGKYIPKSTSLRIAGPFSIQPNSTTRRHEYPWAYFSTSLASSMRVLEIGGGLSGFQFVLSRQGCRVTNVDPGLEAKGVGWHCDNKSIAELNSVFGTGVELINTTIEKVKIEDGSLDRAFSISTLEHVLESERRSIMQHVFAALKPGGLFVLTVDLFLDLSPFTSRTTNKWGSNVDIRKLISLAPFSIVNGDKSELFGFPEFDKDRIQCHLEDYLIGTHPVLIQCFVLEKPQ